ncbi:thioredoxin domain-containing protein [Ruminiclostridium josui]|uniref:thioredoxin domain-containing protein n=1 Tax=Ruminiclostridium josui TaxID=1499 RepID=UPI00046321EE|nr:thioredoxin domain-containing protein [Ruminiclostridium josui]
MTSHKTPNKLVNEKSPYLLQHAYNPVDWYPWGPEAFARAVSEDKPIFLSIGYSTCHWCHVMERESFEDEEVAHILNRDFICIKVDREERPDIDSIYMSVCQALTGHGGWPLTVFLTPDRQPFYAGTYFPKEDSRGFMGLISLLESVKEAWDSKRDNLLESAKNIIEHLTQEEVSIETEISKDIIHEAFTHFKYNFDSKYGGFGASPKFPSPHTLLFLLRYWYTQKEPFALEMVEKTLESMKNGGIFDHIGFGFSRYSTDKKWLVPHFEKMLYDNALLAIAYGETYSATGNKNYEETARQILDYVQRDMTSQLGAFYSAEDADSEGVEGKFYVWSQEEVISVLGSKDGDEYCKLFDITSPGNFEGLNIPNLIETGTLSEQQKHFAEECRKKLFAHREKRIHPYKDDKVLTSWNGLMIAAMAYCGRIFSEERYIESAKRCVDFIYKKLIRTDGRLLARYRDGESVFPAYLEDYAFLVWGLLELYEATFTTIYLKRAVKLTDAMLNLFGEKNSAGLFLYGHDSEKLISRPRESYDGAIPSGNSVAAMNLLRLARITGHHEYENRAKAIIDFFSNQMEAAPTGHSYMLCSYMYSISDISSEVVITGTKHKELVDTYNSKYLPFAVAISNITPELTEIAPFVEGYKEQNDKTAAYVCRNYSCMEQITEAKKLAEVLS